MRCRFKFNRLVKATTIVAFLFGFLALSSPGLPNSPCEVVKSNNIHNTVISYKNANRQIETNTNKIASVGTDGWITLEYNLLDFYEYEFDDDVGMSTLFEGYCSLNIDYNVIHDIFAQECYFSFYYFDQNNEYEDVINVTAQEVINRYIQTTLTINDGYLTLHLNNDNNFVWEPYVDEPTYFLRGTYIFRDYFPFSTIQQEVNYLKEILITKDKGLFDSANIQYGVYDMDNNGFVGPSPSSNIIDLNGGYTTSSTSWGTYENYLSSNTQYFLANVVDFGNGMDISPYKYLFTIGPNESNAFLFGQSLHLYFNNGYVYSINGADIEYGQSAFDIASITNLSGSYILNKIVFTGNNGDYIPFGLSTSTDYTSGYDNGYKYGYENGVESGYNNGYLEGKNDVNEERYQAGYNKGYDDATNRYSDGSLSLTGVLNAIVTAPSKIIKEGLDFDILGFNVGKLVMSLIVIGLVVWAIGFFKKG